jgi:hypothetical protein
MKRKDLSSDQRSAERLFKRLKKQLKKAGFRVYTKKMQERDRERYKIKLSNAAHVKYTLNTKGFIFESEEYRIIIWSTYDPQKKLFSKKGSVYSIIALGANRIFSRQFHRKDGFVERVLEEAYNWVDILNNRPNDPDGKPMYLKRISYGGCAWFYADGGESMKPTAQFVNKKRRQKFVDLCVQKNEYDRVAEEKGRKRLPDFKKTALVTSPMHLAWVSSKAVA